MHAEAPLPALSDPARWLRRLLFLGTGTSGQVPTALCTLPPAPGSAAAAAKPAPACATCTDAMRPGSRNRRGCCSVAVVGRGKGEAEERCVCGGAAPCAWRHPVLLSHQLLL